MRYLKKVLVVMLAVILMTTVISGPVIAANSESKESYTFSETVEHKFYQFVDKLIFVIGKVLNMLIPGKDWAGKIPSLKKYVSEHFYPGKEKFDSEPKEGAEWSIGFGKESFLTNIDPYDGSYYLAGSLEPFDGRVPAGVLDDQGVNTVAISDGDVTMTYSAIDGFGITRGDVLEIRSRLEKYAEENGIISVNVSALHQHSCIDTLGLGAPIVPAVLVNPFATVFKEDAMIRGRNPAFMEELYKAVVNSVTEAVESMSTGSLYYGKADVSDYITDKRDPQAFDGNLERLRFVPDDGGNEIWVCEAGIHPVSVSSSSGLLSSDFPHYVEEYVKNETGADLVYIQGAELAITRNTDPMHIDPDADDKGRLEAMGAAYGSRLTGIEEETELQPLLNVTHREIVVKAENPIHILAGREGLLGSVLARDGFDYCVITELGYVELGGKLGIVLVPGEIDPAILWGGAVSASASWKNESWDYMPWAETCGADTLICFGLCNDQIGYILCDNDVRSMLTENEEVNAVSTKSGSILTEAFEQLISEIK